MCVSQLPCHDAFQHFLFALPFRYPKCENKYCTWKISAIDNYSVVSMLQHLPWLLPCFWAQFTVLAMTQNTMHDLGLVYPKDHALSFESVCPNIWSMLGRCLRQGLLSGCSHTLELLAKTGPSSLIPDNNLLASECIFIQWDFWSHVWITVNVAIWSPDCSYWLC